TGLKASPSTSAPSITLSFDTVPVATKYNIKRSTTTGTETVVASTSSTIFVDSNLQPGTAYFYKVSAVTSTGKEGPDSTELATATAAVGTGTGLQADYYNLTQGTNGTGDHFFGTIVTRIDPQVDFGFGGGPYAGRPVDTPLTHGLVNNDDFTGRWDGQVQALF